jgi:RES domain-containing protein
MALQIEPLLEVPDGARKLTVYRNILLSLDGKTPAEGFVPNPNYAQPDSGRWATPSGTLYTACTEEVSWSEYCRQAAAYVQNADPSGAGALDPSLAGGLIYESVGTPLPARAFVRLEFELDRVADLTTSYARSLVMAAHFDVTHLRRDDYGDCSELARLGERIGWQAMLVPSAAWDPGHGRCVAIFKAGRTGFRDRAVVQSPARPTLQHAWDTRYREGERPTWLQFAKAA